MFGLLKKIFGSKPAEAVAEVPYKVEAAPVVDTADIALAQMPAGASAVVEAPKAEVPAKKAEPKKKAAPAKKTAPSGKKARKPKSKA